MDGRGAVIAFAIEDLGIGEESVASGVAGGRGFAFGRERTRGVGGIGSSGQFAFLGNGAFGFCAVGPGCVDTKNGTHIPGMWQAVAWIGLDWLEVVESWGVSDGNDREAISARPGGPWRVASPREELRPNSSTLFALFPCYTDFVPKNITIKLSDETALWARRKAAEEDTSVSRLVGEMIEREMRLSDDYRRAFDHWKSHRPMATAGAAQRMSREEVHERS